MNNLCIPHRKTCNSKYTHTTILKHNILYPYLSIKSFARSLSDRAPTSVFFFVFQWPYSHNRYTLVYFITLCFFLETSLRTERLRLGFPLRFLSILLPNFVHSICCHLHFLFKKHVCCGTRYYQDVKEFGFQATRSIDYI